jgi:thiamine-phosphate pyrophosphorylase
VRAAVAGGVRAVQLREPGLGARRLALLCERLREAVRRHSGLLLVNDRGDVAAAGLADGVQVGHRSLPVAAARRVLGTAPWLGASVHSEAELAAAADDGADFALLSPIWRTTSKPGAHTLGADVAGRWTGGARLPVVWLGGVSAAAAVAIAELPPDHRPDGIAVRSGIWNADDPESAARGLLAAWSGLFRRR